MEQYPVPQFIEEESKIIFFLTFRQFFILVGAGAIGIGAYYVLPFWVFVLIAIPLTLLTVLIGFVKVNGVSAPELAGHFLGFTAGAKKYTWQKKAVKAPLHISKAPEISSLAPAAPEEEATRAKARKFLDLKLKKRVPQ
jgi:hypothetical protein